MSLKRRLLRSSSAIILIVLGGYVAYSVYDMVGEGIFNLSSHFTPRHVDSKSELDSFKRLMNSWKFTGRPHALIYFVLPSKEDTIYRLKHYTLRRLENFYSNHYQYPIIIFHDQDLPNWHKVDIKLRSSSPLFFQQVNFTNPKDLMERSEPFLKDCSRSLDDRSISGFHVKSVFEHPVFENLDYYLRLDDESTIFGAVEYDLFNYMKIHKLLYGYTFVVSEDKNCVNGLRALTETFIRENDLKPISFKDWPETDVFYNNFEIGNVRFWQQPLVMKYLKYIEDTGGVYKQGWSDALIHTYAVQMFAQEQETYAFRDIYYKFKNKSTQSLAYYALFYTYDVYLRMTVWRLVACCLLFYIIRCRKRLMVSARSEEFQLINSKMV